MRLRHGLLVAFYAVCALALTWPGYHVVNAIEPYVLSLPTSFAWNVGWVGLAFVALLTFHLTEPDDG